MNAEGALRYTAVAHDKKFRVIFGSGHIAQESILTNYVETEDSDQ